MKKTIYQLFIVFVTLLPALSCEKEQGGDGSREEGIKLTLSCDDIATKAPVPGTGSENLIKTVDYFVFPCDNAGNPTSAYTYRGTHEANLESSCTFYIQATFVNNGSYVIYSIVNYPSGRNRLEDFGAVSETAGTTKTYEALQALLVSERALAAVDTEIAANTFTAVSGSSIDPAPESSRTFIMTGLSGKFTVNTGNSGNIKGEVTVNLKRLAAKVDMEFYVRNSLRVEKDGGRTIEVWTPMIEGGNIRLSLNNAVEDAYIGGGDIGTNVSYFDYSPNYDNTVGAEKTNGGNSYTTMTSAPFYTYPKVWSMGDDNEPFLKLIIPWTLTKTVNAGTPVEKTTTSQRELYYKVVLPKELDGVGFLSNKWYRLQVYVSQLGSDADVPEVDVPCGYKVVNWEGNNDFVVAKLVQGLYLDVSNGKKMGDGRTHYTMYSDPIEIPYIAAKGGVTVQDMTMTFTKFSTFPVEEWQLSSSGWTRISPSSGSNSSGRSEIPADLNSIIQVDEDNEIVRINHPLNSNYSGNAYDVAPFTIQFTLHLNRDEGTTYDKEITVTQYPPLYIEVNPHGGTKSDGWVIVNGTANTHPGSSTGSQDVFDDSGNTTKSRNNADYCLGSVVDYANVGNGSATGNNNPNLYKVSASILNLKMTIDGVSDVDMVLGDSREATSTYANNQLKGNDGTAIPGALNGLTGYRKADEAKKNFVSPSLLIASSYGKTSSVSYEGAVKRCAAYQEDGYPAGRWRLPTMAEIEFLIKLSDNSKIPVLFAVSKDSGYNSGYWAAGKELYTYVGNQSSNTKGFVDLANRTPSSYNSTYGTFIYTAADNNQYAGFVRCVYDAWYWTDQTDSGYTAPGTDLGYKPTR